MASRPARSKPRRTPSHAIADLSNRAAAEAARLAALLAARGALERRAGALLLAVGQYNSILALSEHIDAAGTGGPAGPQAATRAAENGAEGGGGSGGSLTGGDSRASSSHSGSCGNGGGPAGGPGGHDRACSLAKSDAASAAARAAATAADAPARARRGASCPRLAPPLEACGGGDGGGQPPPLADWWRRALDGGITASGDSGSATTAAAAAAPVAAALRAVAGGRGNVAAFRETSRRETQTLACLLHRIDSGAPDAPAARAHLGAVRAKMLMRCAAMTLSGEAHLMCANVLGPVDPDYPAASGAGAEPTAAHWAFALRQARLTPEQEDVAADLLGAWRQRSALHTSRRAALLRAAAEGAAGAAAEAHLSAGPQELLVADIAASQTAEVVDSLIFCFAIYDAVLSPEQFAAFVVASYPFVCPLAALDEAIAAARAGRGASPPDK